MSNRLFNVRVTSNANAVIADIRASGLTTDAQNRAAARALNLAATRARTAAARQITARYKMKYGTVLDIIKIEHASADRLIVALTVSGRPLSVASFDARQMRDGVSVNIRGTRKTIKGAFIRKLQSGSGDDYQVVFMRVGAARYPLKAIKTVDVPGVFSREEAQALVDATAIDVFESEFLRQLELLMP